ncbi:hypothetical protein HG535_0A04150 [Zygotorulaspora mrakii]|uniref:Mediator of RNA polymerase II transcription subunit 6 n=1 Tax=Zygotorulaspora mrakii TaxID=42260 RepID=A0A7H9AVZ2_ZYGMR|nr:uncharacterized protein HG535_0A04150 [Zygotorulaspora mrakii]QLG70475.1 hypothetical protein HG535_0A04150 [Zygotorulaspora mrakii]
MNTQLDELQWKSPEWIQAFGLRTDNVLDYFSESPFFSKTSNNQVIKMQKQFSQMPLQPDTKQDLQNKSTQEGQNQINGVITSTTSQQLEQSEFTHLDAMRRDILNRYPAYAMLERELMKMTGVEYVVGCIREPDFWIIKKQNRLAPTQIQVLQDYYIIGANVYQSPTVLKIVQSRLMSTTLHLSKTLQQLQTLTEFQPAQGVQFKRSKNLAVSPSSNANAPGSLSSNNSAAATMAANNNMPSSTAATAQTGYTVGTGTVGTSQLDQNGQNQTNNVITQEMMQKLMFISVKSQPEFI